MKAKFSYKRLALATADGLWSPRFLFTGPSKSTDSASDPSTGGAGHQGLDFLAGDLIRIALDGVREA